MKLATSLCRDPNTIAGILATSIHGQHDALVAIGSAIARTGARSALLFLGPVGVGKTMTAECLAGTINGVLSRYVKIDCARFTVRDAAMAHATAALQPLNGRGRWTVVLDEVEKTDRDVLTAVLAKLRDRGDVIVVMTSNMLHDRVEEIVRDSHASDHQPAFRCLLRDYFPTAVVDAITAIIPFRRLGDADIHSIVVDEAGIAADTRGIENVGFTAAANRHIVATARRSSPRMAIAELRTAIDAAPARSKIGICVHRGKLRAAVVAMPKRKRKAKP